MAVHPDTVNSDGLRHVLQVSLTQVLKRRIQLVADLAKCIVGYVNAPGFGQGLQARGHVHALTEQVSALDHDAAKIDSNAKVHAPVFGQIGVPSDGSITKPLERDLTVRDVRVGS